MKLNDLVKESHGMAKERGWWDTPREDGTLLMLMVCELAEAAEEARKDNPPVYFNSELGKVTLEQAQHNNSNHDPKCEGLAIELVDTVIRIADYFGAKGWDMEELVRLKMDYNKDRPYRHGGKKF